MPPPTHLRDRPAFLTPGEPPRSARRLTISSDGRIWTTSLRRSNLYPTDVFTVANDFFADTATPADFAANPLGALWQDFVGFFEHGVYLGGLPESEILTAIDTAGVVDGATTYFSLADPANLLEALWDTTLGSFGIAVP